jgi:hypothetical protein
VGELNIGFDIGRPQSTWPQSTWAHLLAAKIVSTCSAARVERATDGERWGGLDSGAGPGGEHNYRLGLPITGVCLERRLPPTGSG